MVTIVIQGQKGPRHKNTGTLFRLAKPFEWVGGVLWLEQSPKKYGFPGCLGLDIKHPKHQTTMFNCL